MRSNPFENQIVRLARTLTEQFGVAVVCRGDQAFTDLRQVKRFNKERRGLEVMLDVTWNVLTEELEMQTSPGR